MPRNHYNKQKTMTDEAYEKIKQMMFQRKIRPSQRLVYKDLADMLGMSLTPIINALNRLEEQEFLISNAFRGYYVRTIDEKEIQELFEAREALESYIIEQVIIKMKGSDLRILKDKVRIHGDYRPDTYNNKRLILDAHVHIQFAQIVKNELLEKMLTRVFEHLYLGYPPEIQKPERIMAANAEHKELLKRIVERDIPGSVELIRKHVQNGRDFLIESISMQDETELYFGKSR